MTNLETTTGGKLCQSTHYKINDIILTGDNPLYHSEILKTTNQGSKTWHVYLVHIGIGKLVPTLNSITWHYYFD